ncbi:hypothetical protein [Achromobacter marplatensis]|uniref:hypothetical protein n=1 Tax=Achromobacter marplatensis TaxID=470868 RepID=UPI0028E798CF|nr:hypothetical protein [Achromobacter marplatensis]
MNDGPKPAASEAYKLFLSKFDELINMLLPLVRLATQIGRYADAKQFKRMRNTARTVRTRVTELTV